MPTGDPSFDEVKETLSSMYQTYVKPGLDMYDIKSVPDSIKHSFQLNETKKNTYIDLLTTIKQESKIVPIIDHLILQLTPIGQLSISRFLNGWRVAIVQMMLANDVIKWKDDSTRETQTAANPWMSTAFTEFRAEDQFDEEFTFDPATRILHFQGHMSIKPYYTTRSGAVIDWGTVIMEIIIGRKHLSS